MKYPITIKILILSGVALLQGCSRNKEEQKFPIAEIIPVKTSVIKRIDDSQKFTTTGLISTENEVKYSFKIGGVIQKIFVVEGQYFSKGQILAKLKLTEIDAGVTQAKLGFEKAQRDYDRVSNLYKDSVATLEQLQNSKTALDISQRQLESISFNKEYSTIYATTEGFVTRKIASDGEVVNGGTPVLIINENIGSKEWVLKTGVTDKEWVSIKVGSKAIINIDAFPNQAFSGTVSKKLLAADQNSGTFQIEINIQPGNSSLAVGMYGKATIEANSKLTYAVIPYSALIEADGKNAFVFVPYNKSRVKKLPISIQNFNNKEVLISSGLENIEEVIVSNSAFLNENSTITIQNRPL